jgi:anti-anti-sigma factor
MLLEILNLSKARNEPIDFAHIAVKISAVEVYDADRTAEINLLYLALIRGGINRIIVDFTDLTFIDSRGITTLITAAKLIREKKGDIVLINIPEQIETIFRPVNLLRFIRGFPSLSEAIHYLKYY